MMQARAQLDWNPPWILIFTSIDRPAVRVSAKSARNLLLRFEREVVGAKPVNDPGNSWIARDDRRVDRGHHWRVVVEPVNLDGYLDLSTFAHGIGAEMLAEVLWLESACWVAEGRVENQANCTDKI